MLRIGGLTAFGLGLSDALQQSTRAAESLSTKRGARSCVLIWLDGGPSHLETFDPKPDAPREVRGPIGSIATALPGVRLSELLPQTAARLKQVSLVRSVTSAFGEHDLGTHYMLTGYAPTAVLEYPSVGSVIAKLRPGSNELPGHVAVPDYRVGGGKFSGHGFLPIDFRPFAVGGDPARPDFRVTGLDFYPGLDGQRVARRRRFLGALDQFSRLVESDTHRSADPQFEQAYRLLTSPAAKSAFDLNQESESVRNRYGGRTIGQCCLLARRFIERGVRFVTVNNVGWDTHADLYTRLKEGFAGATVPVGLVPALDHALTALVDDLAQRGLLSETLVVVMGEFGRTPKLNTNAGRDHWPRVFSVLMAGGGVTGGQVVGASDARGESPKTRPVSPADIAATVYSLLGIPLERELVTPDGRPVRVSQAGTVIHELIA